MVNDLPANAGDARNLGLAPDSPRSPREGHGNTLQHSRLENLMDRAAWWAAVHEITKNRTRRSMNQCGILVPRPGVQPMSPALKVQFSRSVMSNSLRPHGLQHARPPCPSPTPGACSNSCPSSQ